MWLVDNSQKIVLAVIVLFAIAVLLNNLGTGLTGSATWQGWSGCSVSNPCSNGEGDCDNNNECLDGLKCADNVGPKYGFSSTADVCEGSVSVQQPIGIFGGSSGSSQPIPTSGSSIMKEVPLGSVVSGSVKDSYGNGILEVSPGASSAGNLVTVETSLTSLEDDYKTDVVMEVARGSIKYSNSYGSVGFIDNFLGHTIDIQKFVDKNTLDVLIDGQLQTIYDGQAFIGESTAQPKWVWDLDISNTSNSRIGIENDFIINDASDNPPKVGNSFDVGTCISLPSSPAAVCLSGMTVNSSEYNTFTINYNHSVDLSDADASLIAAKAIVIKTSKLDGIKTAPNVFGKTYLTDKLWIIGNGVVFYEDLNGRVALLKQITSKDEALGTMNNGELVLRSINEGKNMKIVLAPSSSAVSESLTANFAIVNRQISSLGAITSAAEYEELAWKGINPSTSYIGIKDEDHRTRYGIIIRDPKTHGASDEVVLEIPNRQVKARVSIALTATSPSQPAKTVTCTFGNNCFLNQGDTAEISGNKIKLMDVGSTGDIILDVEQVGKSTQIVRANRTLNFDAVLKISNKETYYDFQGKSSATIVVTVL